MFSPNAILDWFATILGDTAQLSLLLLAFRRKLWRQLTFLFVYVIFLVPREAIWAGVSHTPLLFTKRAFYFYYITDFVLIFLRVFIIAEICWRVLRVYPAIRTLAWRFLTLIGLALFSWAAFTAVRHPHFRKNLILIGLQRLNISLAVLLLLLLIIGIYYAVRVHPLYRFVLIGSCIYSAIQIVDMEVGRLISMPTNSIFDYAQRFSFALMIGIWAWGAWRWAGVTAQPPALISQHTYDALSPQIHDRLRDLNDRLAGLLIHGRQ